ncbi:MAG: hypothetical protein QOC81_543 [Thermoanaerobaculia bacterium]|jgi:hypothetical protein|nr:hypothetical protein [Thermoanaerobaculia bacterium]
MFKYAVVLAGVTQLAIAATSLLIPRLLGWRKETALLRPLTRCVFWTYAGYILGTNLWFAALAIGWPSQLLNGTPLAAMVTGFMAVYWLARVVIQFGWFHRALSENRTLFKIAEVVYVTGFAFITIVFAIATILNLRMVGR